MIVDGGQVRFQALICGMPGAGKTTLMRALARRAIVEDGATVIAHDPMGEWRRAWGAGVTSVRDAKDARGIRDGVRAGRLPRVISVEADSTIAADLAADVGATLNTADRVTRPLLLMFDEGALVSGSGSSYQSDADRRLTAIRRHRGVGIAWNVQAPTMLPVQYWQLATDVYTYALASQRDVQTLERRCGLDDGALAFVRRLERYRVVRIRRGVGIVPLWWRP